MSNGGEAASGTQKCVFHTEMFTTITGEWHVTWYPAIPNGDCNTKPCSVSGSVVSQEDELSAWLDPWLSAVSLVIAGGCYLLPPGLSISSAHLGPLLLLF